jgi:hypothetical protein
MSAAAPPSGARPSGEPLPPPLQLVLRDYRPAGAPPPRERCASALCLLRTRCLRAYYVSDHERSRFAHVARAQHTLPAVEHRARLQAARHHRGAAAHRRGRHRAAGACVHAHGGRSPRPNTRTAACATRNAATRHTRPRAPDTPHATQEVDICCERSGWADCGDAIAKELGALAHAALASALRRRDTDTYRARAWTAFGCRHCSPARRSALGGASHAKRHALVAR